jgi:hypothetical protein
MNDPGRALRATAVSREIDVDAVHWVAEVSGASAVGGSPGPVIECVHFRRQDGTDDVVLRAWLPWGRFPDLDDAELRDLHRTASPIQPRPANESGPDPEDAPGRERAVIESSERDEAAPDSRPAPDLGRTVDGR